MEVAFSNFLKDKEWVHASPESKVSRDRIGNSGDLEDPISDRELYRTFEV